MRERERERGREIARECMCVWVGEDVSRGPVFVCTRESLCVCVFVRVHVGVSRDKLASTIHLEVYLDYGLSPAWSTAGWTPTL